MVSGVNLRANFGFVFSDYPIVCFFLVLASDSTLVRMQTLFIQLSLLAAFATPICAGAGEGAAHARISLRHQLGRSDHASDLCSSQLDLSRESKRTHAHTSLFLHSPAPSTSYLLSSTFNWLRLWFRIRTTCSILSAYSHEIAGCC